MTNDVLNPINHSQILKRNPIMNASTTMPVELSQKSIDYILKNSQGSADFKENLLTAVNITLEQVNNKARAKKSAEESIISSFTAHLDLAGRISFAREVGKNTLRKMTHGYPKNLEWLNSRGRITVIGVFRNQPSFRGDNYEDVTSKIVSGSLQLGPMDVVRFSATHYSGASSIGELPLELLREDPIAVAQMVRKECRRHAEKEFNAQNQNVSKRLADLKREYEANLAKLEKEQAKAVVKPIKPAFKAKPKRPRNPVTV
jgi:hypothetical protein